MAYPSLQDVIEVCRIDKRFEFRRSGPMIGESVRKCLSRLCNQFTNHGRDIAVKFLRDVPNGQIRLFVDDDAKTGVLLFVHAPEYQLLTGENELLHVRFGCSAPGLCHRIPDVITSRIRLNLNSLLRVLAGHGYKGRMHCDRFTLGVHPTRSRFSSTEAEEVAQRSELHTSEL
jgi:hypothetical protein